PSHSVPPQESKPTPWKEPYTPHEWRLMHTARIAVRFYPEQARAIEQAAGPALSVVDEILSSADPANLQDVGFYLELEERVNRLAEQLSFARFRKDPKK